MCIQLFYKSISIKTHQRGEKNIFIGLGLQAYLVAIGLGFAWAYLERRVRPARLYLVHIELYVGYRLILVNRVRLRLTYLRLKPITFICTG